MTASRVETLVWILIFGGLLLVGLGASVRRSDDALGLGIAIVGAILAAIGAVLIYVRSRMQDPD